MEESEEKHEKKLGIVRPEHGENGRSFTHMLFPLSEYMRNEGGGGGGVRVWIIIHDRGGYLLKFFALPLLLRSRAFSPFPEDISPRNCYI